MGYTVLAALCAISIFVMTRQLRPNPAVVVALQEAPLPGVLMTGPAGTPSGAAALIPEDLPALTPLSALEVFGPDSLSDKIDGKAELYLASGFKEMACRSFALSGGAGARIEIFVYDMGSPRGAYAVFSGQRRAGGEPSTLTPKAYFSENALFFASGSYYVEIVADRASEDVKTHIEEVGARLLAGLPAAADRIEEASLFPREGLATESVRLSAADSFGLEGFNDVFTAEYRIESEEATAFISVRSSEKDADDWAQRYLKFLEDNGYREAQTEGAPSGARVLSLDGVFEVVMVREQTLAGVHEAESLQAALDLARRLDTELQRKKR